MLSFTSNRTISVRGVALPKSSQDEPLLELRAIHGQEALSEVYTYTLDLATPSEPFVGETQAANLDLKSMIGKELTVVVQLDGMGTYAAGQPGNTSRANVGAGEREISGLVFEARYLGQDNRRGRYELKLKPWIALAAERKDYRIFQNKTVIEIIDEVLKSHYLYSYDKRLGEMYSKLEYQVQYGETDLDFIQRLMQEHGIYWFFEHTNGFHRMVLVDSVSAHRPVESEAYRTLPYYPPDQRIDQEHVSRFDVSQSLQAGVWTTDDYDFHQPKAKLTVNRQLPQNTAQNDLERYEWPGDYVEKKEGEQFARIRIQELHARGDRAYGQGHLRNVVCGTVFTLANYPQGDANRAYLVIASSIRATEIGDVSGQGQSRFETEFVVQPRTVMYRPARTVKKPHTTGPQTAMVTGAPGSEIWTNQYGQVKLKFHWDRSPAMDHTSSCWVRVAYPWAGQNYGSIHVPRVGSEVIVDFENGDPDRPIVTGRVYNAMSMPPWELPENATQSGTLTRSTKNGGYENANAIRFEDKKGEEELWIHAEKDLRTEVEHDESHVVEHDRRKSIEHDETTTVGHDRNETVGNNEQVAINENRSHRIGNNDLKKIGNNHVVEIGSDRTETVGNHRRDRIGANHTTETGGHAEHTVQGQYKLQAGQRIIQTTKTVEMSASDRFVIKGPDGTITIDAGGVTIEGVAIKLKGAVTQSSGWVKNALDLRASVREGTPLDPFRFPFSG